MTADVLIRTPSDITARQLHDLLRLRVDVFVVEQECPYPEIDGRDVESGTTQMWIEQDGEVAATLRVLDDGEVWRIGRVATNRAHRSKGLARQLMLAALQECPERPIVLDAQAHLREWYGAFGFSPNGPEFLEDGIPHIPMRREPSA